MTTANNVTALQTQAEKPKTLKAWVESDRFKDEIAKTLPAHLTPERFIRVALTAMMKNPLLGQCSQNSLFKAMLDLSSLGLEPDGRRAHLIPYKNKQGGYDAQLIIDYKGLIELAKRSGEVVSWRAEVVRENDLFDWNNGVVTHKVDFLKPRGKARAYYSHVRNTNGLDEYEVMTIEDVEAIKKRSKAGNYGPWVTDFDEMAKKTVMRRHSKRLTLSPDLADALERDDDRLEEPKPFGGQNVMPNRTSEFEYQPQIAVETRDAEIGGHGIDEVGIDDDLPNTETEESPQDEPKQPETTQDKAEAKKVEQRPKTEAVDKSADWQMSPANISRVMKAIAESGGGQKLKAEFEDYLRNTHKAKMVNALKNRDTEAVVAWIAEWGKTPTEVKAMRKKQAETPVLPREPGCDDD